MKIRFRIMLFVKLKIRGIQMFEIRSASFYTYQIRYINSVQEYMRKQLMV